LASPTTAVILAGFSLVLVAALTMLSLLTHDPQENLAGEVQGLETAVPFAAVGFLVARRRPQNPIGWILLAFALGFLLSNVGTTYSVFDYRLHQGSLPLGWLAVSLGFLWIPSLMLMALPVLLFPEGKVPSSRWRWSLWVYVVAFGVATISSVVLGVIIGFERHLHILLDGSPNTNHVTGILNALNGPPYLCALIVLVLWLTWIVRLLVSYRCTTGDQRQQTKWLMGGAMSTLIVLVASIVVGLGVPSSTSSGVWQVLVGILAPVGLAALPIGMGIGILKYRLYDVDRLISRTLSYAIVTGLLIGVYVAMVTLATKVLPFSSPLGVAASTLVAVALFNPLRKRVQGLVDRRFNRARYNAEATVAAFAQRVRDDVDLVAVSSEFVRAVQISVEPAHVSLWLRPTGSST
jgi:MFS family permease